MKTARNVETKELNQQMGSRIRQAREYADFTQEQLAEKIDVSKQYISDLERGIVGCSNLTLIRICQALSVSSDYILMGDESGQVQPLDLSVRLNLLSPEERRLMEMNIQLMLDAFNLQHSSS